MTAIIGSVPQGLGLVSALSVCQSAVLTLNPLQLTTVVPVVQHNLCPFHLENSRGQSVVSHCPSGVGEYIFCFHLNGFYIFVCFFLADLGSFGSKMKHF